MTGQEYNDVYNQAIRDAVTAMLNHRSYSYGMMQYELVNLVACMERKTDENDR